jgi:hypothetical protein
MSFRSFLQPLGIRQRRAEFDVFRVDESEISGTSSAGILEGTFRATITKNGTGDYTITLNEPGMRTMVAVGCLPLTEDLTFKISAVSSSAVQVVFANLSGTDTNTDFHLSVVVFYAEDQR